MKVRLKTAFGTSVFGDIVDAAIAPSGLQGVFFDNTNASWWLTNADYQHIEPEAESPGTESKKGLPAIFGQELKRMEVEFK